MAIDQISDQQWAQYERDGYLHLGRLLDGQQLSALQERIDAIMMGTADVPYDRMLMQLDSDTGQYQDMPDMSKGHKMATLNYRKIQDLELDTDFLRYMQRPLFADICRRQYGDVPIGCFRAMFMNKPAQRGTKLPWHQDRWTHLDRDPLITLWTALDPATKANGCVDIIPGSHKLGLINREHPSGFLNDQQAAEHCPDAEVVHLELESGEVAMLHNWLLHSSDVNKTNISRRAFSVCYMDGRTRTTKSESFPIVFDPNGQG